MTLQKTRFLVLPAVALLFVCAGLLGLVSQRPGLVSAASSVFLTTFSITNCNNDKQLQTDVAMAKSGDTIVFNCQGTIPITSTLTITKNLTLDGNGQPPFTGVRSVRNSTPLSPPRVAKKS